MTMGGVKINSFFSWVGGKKALRNLIYARLPLLYSVYIEVFGGAGWVLFGMESICGVEVYNDFNSNLVNLFRCVKERPLTFLLELGFLPLTSRDEFKLLKRFLKRKQFHESYLKQELDIAEKVMPEPDFEEIRAILTSRSEDLDVHRAVTFFKVIRYSYASKGTSFGCKAFDIYKAFSLIWAANRRLKNTVLENQSYEYLIPHYDRIDAFFYIDPPYYETEDYYADVGFTRKDHIKLRNILANTGGKWLLSYNDCRQIRFLYRKFRIEAVERLDNMAQRYDGGKIYKELLISNYDTTERSKHMPEQTSLFGSVSGIFSSKNKRPA